MGRDLMRHGGAPVSSLSDWKFNKELEKSLRSVVAEAKITDRKIECVGAVTSHAMDLATSLDTRRRLLAKDDETLNAVLGELELGFVARARSLQQGMYNGLGG